MDNSVEKQVYGTFFLGSDEFGIRASAIREVVNAPDRLNPNPLYPDYVVGTFTLRETIIPVVNTERLFGRGQSSDLHLRKVAIIDYHSQPIGLIFDRTGDVFESGGESCEYVECAEVDVMGASLGAFWFSDCDRIVQILDVYRLIEVNGALPELGKSRDASLSQNQLSHRGPRFESIVLRIGVLEIALDMSGVQEILAGTLVENAQVGEGVLLGTFDLRGRAVPLIDLALTFNIAGERNAVDLAESRIVVVPHGDRVFGLVVDEISGLVHYYQDELMDYPAFAQSAPDLFSGCITAMPNKEVLQLNLGQLFQLPDIAAAVEHSQTFVGQFSQTDVNDEQQALGTTSSYLCFDMNQQYAVPLADIVEVVDYPDQLVQPFMLHELFDGILNLRGDFIATVSVRSLYGLAPVAVGVEDGGESDIDKHIIVFQCAGCRYGLAVPSVSSIIHVDSTQKHPLPTLLHEKDSEIPMDIAEVFFLELTPGERPAGISVLDLAAIVARIAPVANAPSQTGTGG